MSKTESSIRIFKAIGTLTAEETHAEYCNKCGKLLYVIGRELITTDVLCDCHKKSNYLLWYEF